MAFVTDVAAYDRRAIMREAHRAYGVMKGRGWSFADALRFAWGRAKDAQQRRQAELAAFSRPQQWAA